MCELFGITSAESHEINNDLKEFFSHSNAHPHGWGLACLEANNVKIEKEPIQASKSNQLRKRLSNPIIVKTALAHIRNATIGNIDYSNCHPFTYKDQQGRTWTLIHNGTIFNGKLLNKYVDIQNGDTDSERILLYLVDQINQAESRRKCKMTKEERFNLLDLAITRLSQGNKLNLIVYDGELLYVHTNYKNSLYELKKEKQILFSTVPLGKEAWQPVTFTTLLAYQEGKKLFIGTNHGEEYKNDTQNIQSL